MLAGVLSLVLGFRSAGQSPPAQRSAPPKNPLIEQLGDPDFRKRDAAARRLEAAGISVLPGLRMALGHPDAEVRRRARDLIPTIETAALLAPRRVSLDMTNKSLREIFDEFTRQTGYKIEFWTNSPAQKYSFAFKDHTFWEAVDRVCRVAGLVVQQNYGDERILLQQQEGGQPLFVCYEGAFRFVPTGLQQTRFVSLLAPGKGPEMPAAEETLSVSFSIFSEPRLPFLGLGEVKLDAAYDNEKNSMLPPVLNPGTAFDPRFGMVRRWTSRYGQGNRSFHMQSQFNLHRPSLKATSVKLVRGSIPVTLLAEQKPVVLTDKVLTAKGKKATVGATTFVFDEVSETPTKQYQVKLSVTEDNKDNPNDYTWMNTLYQRIELLDEKGEKFQIFSTGWGNSGPTNVQITLVFGPMGNAKMAAPAKFIFQQWATLHYQVPFEFKDLPLP
jgi:hypothetical protein